MFAFLTGCSDSNTSSNQKPSAGTTDQSQYASSVWPKLHQNNFNNGQSLVDTSSNTGTLKWAFHAGSKVDSSPAIGADGTIYVGCENGNLYALNPADGSQKWAYQTGGEIYISSPAVAADGTIYIGSKTGFFAINPDGTLKWSYPTGDTEAGSPVIDPNGVVYVASWNHNLYAFNAFETDYDYILRWFFTTGDAMAGAPAIDPDLCWVYIGSNDGNVYAVNSGTEIWSFKTDNGMSMPVIGPDGNIYVGGLNGHLYSLNPYTGQQNWKLYLHNPIEATPAIGADGTIYVGTSAPYHANNDAVFAISPAGKEKWGFKAAGAPLDSSAAIGADGTIYIGRQSSNFAAATPSGEWKWIFEGVSNLITTNTTPAIGEDGTIYFGADDGYVYAVH